MPRNFAGGGVIARFALNPFLVVVRTADGGANLSDVSEVVQNAEDAGVLDLASFDTLANGDALYMGAHLPFSGVRFDGTLFNVNASTLTVEYWNGSRWVDLTATDGSAAAGATFGQDGNVIWTVPVSWMPGALHRILGTPGRTPHGDATLFWTRWTVSAALDATVTVANLLSINRSTTYAGIASVETQPVALSVHWGPNGIGAIEALTDAGTANLVINAATRADGGRFT
jgi:hypothetical protein